MYIVYQQDSTRIVNTYKTMAAAKAAITRSSKQHNLAMQQDHKQDPQFCWAIASSEYYYKNIEKTVTRKNMMTGKEYAESVNTPNYMSPSSEAYWSM